MFKLAELLPKEDLERLKNMTVEEISSYIKYFREVLKEQIATIRSFRQQNLETLSSIESYPHTCGLFWIGNVSLSLKLNKRDELSQFAVASWGTKDILLFPTVVYSDIGSLIQDLPSYSSDILFYRNGTPYFHENFLPLSPEKFNIWEFYGSIKPLL